MKIPPEVVSQIVNRTLTNRKASLMLGISEQYFSVLFRRLKLKKVPGPTVVAKRDAKNLSATRIDYRKQVVNQVKNGRKTIQAAAREARCSERTIYRYLKMLTNG